MPEKIGNDVRNLRVQKVDELVDEPINERVGELVDEGGDEHVEFQEEEQPEQDWHAAEIMLRRVHANLTDRSSPTCTSFS